MTADNETPPRSQRPVSDGYRQGIITAITVFIGFSLAFLRYWVFDAPGIWDAPSAIVTIALVVAILLELYALFRALRLADDDEREYGRTVVWFISSVGVLFLGLFLASIFLSQD